MVSERLARTRAEWKSKSAMPPPSASFMVASIASSASRRRSMSVAVARWHARRMAWHSSAMRACMTSSMTSGTWASEKANTSPSTEISGWQTTVPTRSRISTTPSIDMARSASRTMGRLTPSCSASSRSGNRRSPLRILPSSNCSRRKPNTLAKPLPSAPVSGRVMLGAVAAGLLVMPWFYQRLTSAGDGGIPEAGT